MGVSQEYLCDLRKEISTLIISCITLYGYDGIPLKKLNKEFETYSGYVVPYQKFGFDSLRHFLLNTPKVYIRKNDHNEEIVVTESNKSVHMKQLISRQKSTITRKRTHEYNGYDSNSSFNDYFAGLDAESINKKQRFIDSWTCSNTAPKGTVSNKLVNKKQVFNDSWAASNSAYTNETVSERLIKFEKLEAMLPLFYKHQALGDDFFLDIADTKMGYYVPKNGPKECGLCAVGQTIAQLKERVKFAESLAPRVVIMIGFNDLILGRNANNMILDMRELILELKKRNTLISLVTLIQSPKLPKTEQIMMRMDIFNKALLEYAYDRQLQCNVIDMNTTLCNEAKSFRKDFDRLEKVARTDPYKVFSDYGRKVFLSTLKNSLREVIEGEN